MSEILNMDDEKSTLVSKCDGCGANMSFSPEKQMMACAHCGTTKEIPKSLATPQPIEKLNAVSAWQKETHIYTCNNCGAASVLSKQEIAVNCPFCGTSNIVESKELSGLKPNGVVPFKIGAGKASDIAQVWIKKRFFAPDRFKQSAEPEEIEGVYNPAFSFNADTLSSYSGTLVKYIYETKTVNGKKVTTRKENRFNISGTLPKNFAELLIQAQTTIKQKTIDKIAPFDTGNCPAYNKDYLFGFIASQHTKNGPACWTEARGIMDAAIKRAVLSKYTYDRVERLNISTAVNAASFKYNMLPIYIGHCTYKEKLYNFYINGANGKLDGKAPVSAIKVTLTILFPIGLAVLAVRGIIKLFRRKK